MTFSLFVFSFHPQIPCSDHALFSESYKNPANAIFKATYKISSIIKSGRLGYEGDLILGEATFSEATLKFFLVFA